LWRLSAPSGTSSGERERELEKQTVGHLREGRRWEGNKQRGKKREVGGKEINQMLVWS